MYRFTRLKPTKAGVRIEKSKGVFGKKGEKRKKNGLLFRKAFPCLESVRRDFGEKSLKSTCFC